MGHSSKETIVCLSTGLVAPKKRDTAIARQHLYMNYGLLGLATLLQRAGWHPVVVHGGFEDPACVVDRLFAAGHLPSAHPILLSLPSSFALSWAGAAVRAIRERDPASKIVVGGRWVTADDGTWIRRQLPGVDLVVFGTAEGRILDLVRPGSWSSIPGTDIGEQRGSSDVAPHLLAYDLIDGFERYQPSVEASRGCGMGCGFCAEAREPLGLLSAPALVAAEFEHCVRLFGRDDLHPYLEASFLRPDGLWCVQLAQALSAQGLNLAWRTETRVDALSQRHIQPLAKAGLRVLDLGLESASHRQLLAMRKTSNPAAYLRRAGDLLRACRDTGIWVKVNVLLHAGETRASLAETHEWLERHRDCIKGLSVGPTIVFRCGCATRAHVASLEVLGARLVDPDALEREGYAHLHLSDELPHEAARDAGSALSREFMTARDYFDLKSFSYLPRGTRWKEFLAWGAALDPAMLPFVWPGAERPTSQGAVGFLE